MCAVALSDKMDILNIFVNLSYILFAFKVLNDDANNFYFVLQS